MTLETYDQVIAVNKIKYLDKYRFWKRLEPRTREDNFTRSIQARVRDPLWMLTRQWQVGEFTAEDAGSPVKVRLQTERTHITHYKPKSFEASGQVNPIPEHIPLETLVEQEKPITDVRMSIQIGLQFERELKKQGVSNSAIVTIKREFALTPPHESKIEKIDDETLEILTAVAKPEDFNDADQIVISGQVLLSENGLVSKTPQIPEELQVNLTGDLSKVAEALKNLHSWYTTVYFQPVSTEEISWNHSSFDYSFCVSAPKNESDQHVLEITESPGGEMDWPHFTVLKDTDKRLNYEEDVQDVIETDPEEEFIPVPVNFKGMPNSRWWAFEDAKIDFGSLDVKTTDLGKLLLMEFALIYGDDWFQIPIPLKIGSICKIKSLQVQDVFGNILDIERAGSGEDQNWERWDMFSISYKREKDIHQIEGSRAYDSADFLFLPPTLGRNEIAPNIDEVKFIRDEMANKVWAIEHTIANGLGLPLSGFDYWKQRKGKMEEKEIREKLTQLLNLFNTLIPDILQTSIDSAIEVEGIVDLQDDVPEIDQLLTPIRNLKRMLADETDISYINSIFLQTLIIDGRRKAFQARLEGEEDIQVKTALRRFLNVLRLYLQALSDITPAFKRARAEATLEALQTHYESIRDGLKTLIDPSLLSNDQKELLGLIGVSEDRNIPIYKLMSSVPENWIPYVPVRTGSDNRSIQLIQANMIRSERDETPGAIRARSRILKSAEQSGEIHRVDEEAVARHGLKIQMHFQRARWINGSTHVWIGRKVGPGRGEGSSGLKFDYLKVVENK